MKKSMNAWRPDKVTQKQLRAWVKAGTVTDITAWQCDDVYALGRLHLLGLGHGVYGVNAVWLEDEHHNEYVITSRSSNIFLVL